MIVMYMYIGFLKKKNIFFFEIGIFFKFGGKSHLNSIGNGAKYQPLRTHKKKIPDNGVNFD